MQGRFDAAVGNMTFLSCGNSFLLSSVLCHFPRQKVSAEFRPKSTTSSPHTQCKKTQRTLNSSAIRTCLSGSSFCFDEILVKTDFSLAFSAQRNSYFLLHVHRLVCTAFQNKGYQDKM